MLICVCRRLQWGLKTKKENPDSEEISVLNFEKYFRAVILDVVCAELSSAKWVGHSVKCSIKQNLCAEKSEHLFPMSDKNVQNCKYFVFALAL